MSAPGTTALAERPKADRLRDLLLAYLNPAGPGAWPGTDGMCIEDVLLAYLPAADEGLVPDRLELAGLHPDLEPELTAFFRTSARSGM